jgi:hypothetical protein
MHVVQTAGVPPSAGRTSRATIGWTEKRSAAETKRVAAKRAGRTRRKAIALQVRTVGRGG